MDKTRYYKSRVENKKVPICRSVLWPEAQGGGGHTVLRPMVELLTCNPSCLPVRECVLHVEDVTVGLHPGVAAAVCRRPL